MGVSAESGVPKTRPMLRETLGARARYAPPVTEPEKDPVHVRVLDLKKAYDDAEVLRGVTFDILRGQINVLIGGSGAGKSVFTRQLLRLESPDSGQILVDGVDIVPLDDWQLVPIRK